MALMRVVSVLHALGVPNDRKHFHVKAGSVASLLCRASGDPPPIVLWRKNGKRVMSGSQSSRYLVHEFPPPGGGALLRIEPVRAGRDDATYECVAENGVGDAVSAEAVLSVFELIKRLEDEGQLASVVFAITLLHETAAAITQQQQSFDAAFLMMSSAAVRRINDMLLVLQHHGMHVSNSSNEKGPSTLACVWIQLDGVACCVALLLFRLPPQGNFSRTIRQQRHALELISMTSLLFNLAMCLAASLTASPRGPLC
ncbi:hypothetical protein B566_EDAN009398 [Ephemera danica]|nr:hypothetical protein B566_EDAN009398 [Ephemera danica]